jgi:glycosyltransferase involved in cell wall biosynthesis
LSISTQPHTKPFQANIRSSIDAGRTIPLSTTPRRKGGAIKTRECKAERNDQSVDHNALQVTLGLTPEHEVAVYIGRIAVQKNVQALIDAMEHLDESYHAVIVGPQYVPLERLGSRVHLLPAKRRIGNWLGNADILCHPSNYKSHCFWINEAWLAGVPVV